MTPIYCKERSRRAVRSSHRGRRKRLRGIERLEDRTLLAAFTVNSLLDTVDANPGDGMARDAAGQTTLRAAIMESNARAGDDSILLPAGEYKLTLAGANEDGAAAGDLDVAPNGRLIITGSGSATTFIDAAGLGDRVFQVLAFANLSVAGVTVRNGDITGAPASQAGDGGGFLNAGALTISSSVVSANEARDFGGGVANVGDGALTIADSTIASNLAPGAAGIFIAAGNVTVTRSTVSNNSAVGGGGGIFNLNGTLTVLNSTVSGNSAQGNGGGISNTGELTIRNSTIAENTAGMSGGGIHNTELGNVTAQNTIFADNQVVGMGGVDFSGLVTSLGSNLIGDASGSSGWITSDLQNVDSMLGPLANNGGPTQTHALLAGSPTIDAGENAGASATDQRSAPWVRIFNGTVDIGAYERQLFSFVVDTAVDENDGNYAAGDLSLREAIFLTNSNPGRDTITGGGTLSLGELLITSDLSMRDMGLNGSNMSRVLHIAVGISVDIAATTIRNGRAAEGGAIRNDGVLTISDSTISENTATIGGGLLNNGTLTITRSTVSNNDATDGTNGRGGGIANFGQLTIQNSTITDNTAASLGGGIYNAEAATLSLIDSTVGTNSATGFVFGIRGGGIYNLGTAAVTRSTISGNSASPEGSSGGGIYNQAGTLTVSNSTISGNSANQTGGIFNNAQVTIKHSTITANSTNMFVGPPSEGSGGITNSPAGSVVIENTIIANNTAGTAGGTPDYFGSANSLGDNLIGDTTGSSGWVASDLQNVDPLLGPLADNGGPTKTHALLAGSPAIDAGNNQGAPLTDQRGEPFDRIVSGTVDIGAYESQPLRIVVDTAIDENDGNHGAGDLSLREAIVLTSGNPDLDIIEFAPTLAGSTITLTLGELLIAGDLTLNGLGANRISISGNLASRVLNIAAGATVEIKGVTIQSGRSSGNGAGILNAGALTISESTVLGNAITGMFANGKGGGIYNSASGTVIIVNSMITSNSVGLPAPEGGGIYNLGILTVANSAITGNSALARVPGSISGNMTGSGGGIYNAAGTVSVTNTTISGNTAANGGAIRNSAEMAIHSSTIASNHAVGGLISPAGVGGISSNGTLKLQNTIIAQNVSNGFVRDFAGVAMSLGNNLIGHKSGNSGWIETDQLDVDPRLGPLADNGGPTMTHALLHDSPAIDAGKNSDAPATDQRGVSRPQDGDGDGTAVVDIGAYEFVFAGFNFAFEGTTGNDVFLVQLDSAGNLQVFANESGTGMPILSEPAESIDSLAFDTLGGGDRLIIDWINGNPLPKTRVVFAGGGQSAVGDMLILRADETPDGIYSPSTTNSFQGIVTIGSREITLTDIEQIDTADFREFSLITPNANDTLQVAHLLPATARIVGTSGSVILSTLTVSNVLTFILDAATNDAGEGNDAMSVSGTGAVPNGVGFVQYRSGTGTNTVSIESGTARIDATVDAGGTLNTTVAGGGRLVTHRLRQSALALSAGSRATILPDGTDAATSVLNSLTIEDGATLDINDNTLIIDYTGDSPVATIRDKIAEARGGVGVGQGTWTGTGITSSTAQQANATVPDARSVGYAENATLPLGPYTAFRGQPVDDTAVLIAYTRTADANLDGVVNDDDVTIVGATYAPGVTQPHWALGDFDFNGFVDDDDVTLLGVFYDSTAAPLTMPPMNTAASALNDGNPREGASRILFSAWR